MVIAIDPKCVIKIYIYIRVDFGKKLNYLEVL